MLDLTDGAWVIRDHPQPDVTLVSAGSMRETALSVAARLEAECDRAVRLVEVFCISRFRGLPVSRKEQLIAPGIPVATVHNAPGSVLGRSVLPDTADGSVVAIGADGFGYSGWPISRLYEETGLSEDRVFTRIREALRIKDPRGR